MVLVFYHVLSLSPFFVKKTQGLLPTSLSRVTSYCWSCVNVISSSGGLPSLWSCVNAVRDRVVLSVSGISAFCHLLNKVKKAKNVYLTSIYWLTLCCWPCICVSDYGGSVCVISVFYHSLNKLQKTKNVYLTSIHWLTSYLWSRIRGLRSLVLYHLTCFSAACVYSIESVGISLALYSLLNNKRAQGRIYFCWVTYVSSLNTCLNADFNLLGIKHTKKNNYCPRYPPNFLSPNLPTTFPVYRECSEKHICIRVVLLSCFNQLIIIASLPIAYLTSFQVIPPSVHIWFYLLSLVSVYFRCSLQYFILLKHYLIGIKPRSNETSDSNSDIKRLLLVGGGESLNKETSWLSEYRTDIVEDPIRLSFGQSDLRPVNANITGLPNLRNSCFVNVIFQVLLRSNSLVDGILTIQRPLDSSDPFLDNSLLSKIFVLFKSYFNRSVFIESDLIGLARVDVISDFFSGHQHDCFEFFSSLIEYLHLESSAIDVHCCSDFFGSFRHTIASNGDVMSTKIQSFSNMLVYLPSDTFGIVYNLVDLINQLCVPEKLPIRSSLNNIYSSLFDADMGQSYKTMSFEQLPVKLVIQISRVINSPDGLVKNSNVVQIPLNMDLMSETGLVSYECDLIIIHIGSVSLGHYYCICKNSLGWSLIDDTVVRVLSDSELDFYLNKSCEVYGVVYNKCGYNTIDSYNRRFPTPSIIGPPSSYEYGNVRILKRKINDVPSPHPLVLDEDDDSKIPVIKSSSLSILFCNTRSLRAFDKINALKFEGRNDDIICLNETNYTKEDEYKLLYHQLGVKAEIVGLNNMKFYGGRPVYSDNLRDLKKNGFGTCVISKKNDNMKILDVSRKFEIIICEVRIAQFRGLLLTAYRSPSMTNLKANTEFFEEISNFISKNEGLRNHFIIYLADDNIQENKKHNNRLIKLRTDLCLRYRLVNLITGQPTRLLAQPDSCLAYFDPSAVSLEALVIGKIHHRMDHSGIRLSVSTKAVIPCLPKYNRLVSRKVRKLSDDDIDILLEHQFRSWYDIYFHIHVLNGENDRSCISNDIVDSAVESFIKIIEDVKTEAWVTVWSRLESSIDPTAKAKEVEISMADAKLSKLAYRMKACPDNLDLRKSFLKLQTHRSTLLRAEITRKMTKDMSFQNMKDASSSKHFFKLAGSLLSNENIIDNNTSASSSNIKTRDNKRIENDNTYFNRDIINDLFVNESVIPSSELDLELEKEDIVLIINDIKRIDPFYKFHSFQLRYPILVIMKLIQYSRYIPQRFKHSKLTQLPKRHIYSLDSLPKICEKILHKALENCLQSYYSHNDDPVQMAYERDRGCESCNSISLMSIEKSLLFDKSACMQVYIDLVKAFNSANRQTIVNEAQKIAGAGELMKSWFTQRTYDFDGKIYNLKSNCGVLPGTLLGVVGFKLFINTDKDLTNLNHDLLWASSYSDDRSPIANAQIVNNGLFQKSLSASVEYMKTQGCKYHLTGSKAPHLLYFSKSNVQQINNVTGLKIDDTCIKSVERTRILGLNLAIRSDRVGSSTIFRKYGYVLEPPVGRFCSIARKIQCMQGMFTPELLKQFVSAYFCGLFRFCAGLYWLRSSNNDLMSIRFYYSLCLSSILGLDGYEALGASCCSNQSVTEDNAFYKKMLVFIGMPSLKDMSITSARTIINQVFEIDHKYFSISSSRCERSELLGEDGLPRVTSWPYRHTILNELLSLAKFNTFRENEPKWKKKIMFDNIYQIAIEQCSSSGDLSQCQSGSVDPLYVATLYKNLCRDQFGILDINERRLQYRSSNKLVINTTCRVRPPYITKKTLTKSFSFKCISVRTNVSLAELTICRICNSTISPISTVTTACHKCARIFHNCCIELYCPRRDTCVRLCCKSISDSLVLGGGIKLQSSIVLRDKCLLCGYFCGSNNKVTCSMLCGFGIHPRCFTFLNRFALLFNVCESQFKCNHVTVSFTPREINMLLDTNTTISMRDSLLLSGKVSIVKYNKRQRRYVNDLTRCKCCGNLYDLNENNHILSCCPKLSSPSVHFIKRSKFLLENKAYLLRITEYSKFEASNFFPD